MVDSLISLFATKAVGASLIIRLTSIVVGIFFVR
jgi:hypothetical protein